MEKLINQIRANHIPFDKDKHIDRILDEVGDAKYVLLGEASHGTSEFYTVRSEITKKLIKEKNFSVIAVEGDWPSCQRVNSFVKGFKDSPETALEALEDFKRWPTWMWANEEIKDLINWLKNYNETHSTVGFYGIDVYSLWESIDEIYRYLKDTNSPDLANAEQAFNCFKTYNRQAENYAVSAALLNEGCREEVIQLLSSIQKHKSYYSIEEEEQLNLEVNALVAANAEHYYQTMVTNDNESWNVRDRHMVEAIEKISDFHGKDTKIIIWEHNTHIGDARATDMKAEGMINVGQLIRENNPREDVYTVGFGTHRGSVIAAPKWGAKMREIPVPSAMENSWEDAMHKAGAYDQLIFFTDENRSNFSTEIGHRAIGVVYNPEFEAYGNYVPSKMGERYDCFIFLDKTNALRPISIEKIMAR